jgi:hypothetical protein
MDGYDMVYGIFLKYGNQQKKLVGEILKPSWFPRVVVLFWVFLICCRPDLHVTFICWLRNNPFLDNSAWQAQHHAPLTLIERISN